MLVAHRNFVSVFDLCESKWFEEKIEFTESVHLIAINERGQPKDTSNLLHDDDCNYNTAGNS